MDGEESKRVEDRCVDCLFLVAAQRVVGLSK